MTLSLCLLLLSLAPAARAQGPAPAEPDWVGLARGLESSRKQDRISTVRALGGLNQERAAAYLRPILLEGSSRDLRLEAVQALTVVPGEEAVAVLGEAFADKDLKLRLAVVSALRRRPEESAAALLARALADPETDLRVQAVLALGARLGARQAQVLTGCLKDSGADVRQAAVYALGAIGGETSVWALSEVVSGDHKKRIKALAADILGQLGSRTALPALVSALDGADDEVLKPALDSAIRRIMAQTTARVKAEEAIPGEPPKPAAAAPAPPAPPRPAADTPVTPAVSSSSPTAAAVAVPVDFKLKAPQAKLVQLAASFARYKPRDMVRDVSGNWMLTLYLTPGSYLYQFLVDGEKVSDPENPKAERSYSVVTVLARQP